LFFVPKTLQPSIGLAGDALLIMQFPDGVDNLGHEFSTCSISFSNSDTIAHPSPAQRSYKPDSGCMKPRAPSRRTGRSRLPDRAGGGAGFRSLDANTPAPRQEQAGSVIVAQPWPSRAVGFMHSVDLTGAKEVYPMSNSNLKKPGGGSRARKADPARSQKPDQSPDLKPAQLAEEKAPMEAAAAAPIEAAVAAPVEAAVAAPVEAAVAAPVEAAVATHDVISMQTAAPANTPTIDFQTIAMAYGNYSRKSFEQTKSYVEKLASVRSLDKAIEIQAEFAKQAYETFVTESQKIRELYSGLARQSFEAAVTRMIPAAR
jgi:hypothetical protein